MNNRNKENLRLFEKRSKELQKKLQEEYMQNNPDVLRQLQIQKANKKQEEKLEQQQEKIIKLCKRSYGGE